MIILSYTAICGFFFVTEIKFYNFSGRFVLLWLGMTGPSLIWGTMRGPSWSFLMIVGCLVFLFLLSIHWSSVSLCHISISQKFGAFYLGELQKKHYFKECPVYNLSQVASSTTIKSFDILMSLHIITSPTTTLIVIVKRLNIGCL